MIVYRLLLMVNWLCGRILYHLFGQTCANVDGSYYIGHGQYTRRDCILAPGHWSACVTEWEWNNSMNRYIRFWFASDDTGTYARAEFTDAH